MSVTTEPSTNLQRQIAATKKRLASLEQAASKLPPPGAADDPKNDWLFGGPAIAEFLDWSLKQLYHRYHKNELGDAVWKMGRRTMVGSRQKLRALPARFQKSA
jgi:hypothetical protein